MGMVAKHDAFLVAFVQHPWLLVPRYQLQPIILRKPSGLVSIGFYWFYSSLDVNMVKSCKTSIFDGWHATNDSSSPCRTALQRVQEAERRQLAWQTEESWGARRGQRSMFLLGKLLIHDSHLQHSRNLDILSTFLSCWMSKSSFSRHLLVIYGFTCGHVYSERTSYDSDKPEKGWIQPDEFQPKLCVSCELHVNQE